MTGRWNQNNGMTDGGVVGSNCYPCPHCFTSNYRTYTPTSFLTCGYCHKTYNVKDAEDAGKASAMGYGKIAFRDRMDSICDRFRPVTAWIYNNFAVFEFINSVYANRFSDTKFSDRLLFDGLELAQRAQTVAVMEVKDKPLA